MEVIDVNNLTTNLRRRLAEIILSRPKRKNTYEFYRCQGQLGELEKVIKAVSEQERIDITPATIGHWVREEPMFMDGYVYHCSICKEKTRGSVMRYPRYRYCPMCGSLMKEEE